MRTRRLGTTDIELTEIGLGTWVFGGRWGGADDADSAAACHAALDAGINWIDTADIYGQGRAEKVVGRVVAERDDDVIVSTKGGVAWEFDEGLRIWREASADYLKMSLERSLTALARDSVDIYHVHWPVPGVDPAETIGALDDMRREGKVRAIAVSNYDRAQLEAAGAVAQIDAFQAGYHMMRPEIEGGELQWCAEHGAGVLAYGPIAHGLFTGKMDESTTFAENDWRAGSEFFTDDAWKTRVAVSRELAGIADDAGRAGGLAELAVAWVLRRPEVTSAIIGGRDAAQASADARLADTPLTDDEQAAIAELLARHPETARPYGHGEPPTASN